MATLAILIVGISKGGLGGGLGVLGVPLMSLTMPPAQAAAILLPILCVMDVIALQAFWKQWSTEHLLRLLPAALFGTLVGALTFKYLRASDVRLMVGLMATGFALNYWFKPFQRFATQKPGVKSARLWGSISGFTSFIAHAGGAPANIYLLPQKLDKSVYQATTVIFFGILNGVKLIPYALLGQFNSSNLSSSLLLVPLAGVGVWLGYKLHHRIPEQQFFKVAYVLLFLTGCKLMADGVTGFTTAPTPSTPPPLTSGQVQQLQAQTQQLLLLQQMIQQNQAIMDGNMQAIQRNGAAMGESIRENGLRESCYLSNTCEVKVHP